MLHRPIFEHLAPNPGFVTSNTANSSCRSSDNTWRPQDFLEDDDVGNEVSQALPVRPAQRPGSIRDLQEVGASNMSATFQQAPDDIFARGDPKRFSYLLSEIASEYELVASATGVASTQMAHSFPLPLMTASLDLAGPCYPGAGSSKRSRCSKISFRSDAGCLSSDSELPPFMARWERLTRNVMGMQSSCTHDVRDFWHQKRGTGQTRQSATTGEDPGEGPGPLHKDLVYLVWTKGNTMWLKNSKERSMQHHIGQVGKSLLVVHPDSVQHLVWSALGLAFVVLDFLSLTMSVFGMDRPNGLVWSDCIYWSLDVFHNLRLGFRMQDETVMQVRRVAQQYLRTWFCFDFLLMAAGWGFAVWDNVGPGTSILRYFRIARLSRLIRVSKFVTSFHEWSFRFQSDLATLLSKTVIYMCMVGVWIHLSGCIYYWIGDRDDGWVRALDQDLTPQLSYVISVHWAASQLQGGIDIYPSFKLYERIFVVVNLMGSIAVLAIVVSKITTLLHSIQAAKAERNLILNTARRFADTNGVRPEVLLEIYRYLARRRYNQARERETAAEVELFSHLPFQLRRRLLQEARWPQMKHKLVFMAIGHSSKHFQTQLLCDVLQSVVHLPDHLVFQYGSICSRVYVITSGDGHYTRYAKTFAAMISGNSTIQAGFKSHSKTSSLDDAEVNFETDSKSSSSSSSVFQQFESRHRQLQGSEVGKGDLFCEFALWTPWLHKGDLEAVAEVMLFTINIGDFSELVSSFASVQRLLSGHAERVVTYLETLDEQSDLSCSEHVMQELVPKKQWSTNLLGRTASSV